MTGCGASLLLVAFSFIGKDDENIDNSGLAVLGLALYLSAFSLGMGPGAWLIPSEVFAISIRAKAMSVATFSNRLTGTLMSSTFLTTANAMSWAGFFVLLAVICLLAAAFLYFFLPETKGRSLEDMSMYFAEITGDNSILEVEESILRRKNQSNSGGNASESMAPSDPPSGTMT
jgi:sugar phosphate permease